MNPRDFDLLIEGLRSPGAYDHPVSKVTVIETHISAVLLAGEFAYKLKKPVNFGFVNFSTLEKRRQYCREELRLNRRFAPELYLDVVAIHGSLRTPRFGNGGPVLEHAVKMQRFNQDALLARCIEDEDRITAPMVDAFAGDVAAVHAGAAAAGPDDGLGTPEVIVSSVQACWEPIRAAGLVDGEPEAARLAPYMEERGAALDAWFAKRLHAGRVRECHGDLHLGNLLVMDGSIRAFDCIEFNPKLRWIDVANDIAFTTMDLRYHGTDRLARRFRNAYLDAAGDYSILRVLHYYEVYRALVRAMVAALRESEDTGTALEDARRHLSLAARLMTTTTRPALVVTCGLSGSGKTRASVELVSCSEAVRIRSDVERRRRPEPGAERYSEASVERVYQRLLAQAAEIMEAGYPVIVDATFIKRARRDQFRRLAEHRGVPFRILYCTASDAVLRRRIRNRIARGADASEADLDVLNLQLEQMEPPAEEELAFVVPCDTGRPPPVGNLLSALALAGSRAGD